MELGLLWLAHTVGSAGIGIILFTIFVRLVLSPLQITQLRNAKKMQRLQPLMAELKQKHGKDREKLTQATMALYREHNANPAMGCLPTLLQFPILIGLFYGLLHLGQSPTVIHHLFVAAKSTCGSSHPGTMSQWLQQCYAVSGSSIPVSRAYDLYHAHFLWLSNGLGQHDPLYILPVLAGITQWIQSRMMLVKSSDQQQQMMNTMMNFMPLMIIFFATRYASGLSLYWVTSTIIGIAIQSRITGWGLLPRPGELLAARAALSNRGSNGIGKTARPVRPLPSSTPQNGDGNGQSADGEKTTVPQSNTGEPRAVRKRANRARGGGRAGGRRG